MQSFWRRCSCYYVEIFIQIDFATVIEQMSDAYFIYSQKIRLCECGRRTRQTQSVNECDSNSSAASLIAYLQVSNELRKRIETEGEREREKCSKNEMW